MAAWWWRQVQHRPSDKRFLYKAILHIYCFDDRPQSNKTCCWYLLVIFFFAFSISRNNEKRKEKSRDAARCRRSREGEIFTDLANVLPARREEVDQLDKASIMRLSIAYLKVRGMLDCCKFTRYQPSREVHFSNGGLWIFILVSVPSIGAAINAPKEVTAKSEFPLLDDDKMLMQALDGFLLVISHDGDVTYVSENVATILGIQQVSKCFYLVLVDVTNRNCTICLHDFI